MDSEFAGSGGSGSLTASQKDVDSLKRGLSVLADDAGWDDLLDPNNISPEVCDSADPANKVDSYDVNDFGDFPPISGIKAAAGGAEKKSDVNASTRLENERTGTTDEDLIAKIDKKVDYDPFLDEPDPFANEPPLPKKYDYSKSCGGMFGVSSFGAAENPSSITRSGDLNYAADSGRFSGRSLEATRDRLPSVDYQDEYSNFNFKISIPCIMAIRTQRFFHVRSTFFF